MRTAQRCFFFLRFFLNSESASVVLNLSHKQPNCYTALLPGKRKNVSCTKNLVGEYKLVVSPKALITASLYELKIDFTWFNYA